MLDSTRNQWKTAFMHIFIVEFVKHNYKEYFLESVCVRVCVFVFFALPYSAEYTRRREHQKIQRDLWATDLGT